MTISPFSPFTGSIGPLTNITPFTHRDNSTYLRILQEIVNYINNTLRPEMDGELARILAEFQGVLDASNAQFAETLAESQAEFNATKADWLTQFDAFMADVVAQIALLNDAAIKALIENKLSLTRSALVTTATLATNPNRVAYSGTTPTNWENLGYKLTLSAMRDNMAPKLKQTIYMPWVVRVPAGTLNKMGEYYMYWSTDHDNNTGGIFMAYADHPEGPWIPYYHPSGWVFNDGGAGRGNQTEIPVVVWFAGKFHLYYQNKGSSLSPALQAVFVATSLDGLTWTKTDNGIYPTNLDMPGSMQPGYHSVNNMGERLVAFLNISGGEYSRQGMAHSMDGLTWTIDKELHAGRVNISGSNTYRNIWSPRLFTWKNELWASTAIKSLSAGLDDAAYNKSYMVKVKEDLRGFKGGLHETNFAGSCYIDHDGELYGFASYYNKANLSDNNGGVSVSKLVTKW